MWLKPAFQKLNKLKLYKYLHESGAQLILNAIKKKRLLWFDWSNEINQNSLDECPLYDANDGSAPNSRALLEGASEPYRRDDSSDEEAVEQGT